MSDTTVHTEAQFQDQPSAVVAETDNDENHDEFATKLTVSREKGTSPDGTFRYDIGLHSDDFDVHFADLTATELNSVGNTLIRLAAEV